MDSSPLAIVKKVSCQKFEFSYDSANAKAFGFVVLGNPNSINAGEAILMLKMSYCIA